MAVSYDDVEERALGRQAKIANLAEMQLDNEISDADRALNVEQQGLNEQADAAMTQDAAAFIEQMDQVHDNGGDPMEIFNRLPPEMQEKVSMLLQQDSAPVQEQEFQPMPQQAAPQQQPVNITDTAKQIAQL